MRANPTIPLLLALAACGGSSRSAPAPEARITPDLAITEQNAVDCTKAVVRAAFDLQRVAYIGTAFVKTPKPQPDPQGGTGGGTSPVTLSVTVPGPEGGEAVFTWDDVSADGVYSTGDEFTISFDDYGADGLVLQGVMRIVDVVAQGLIGSLGAWFVDANLELRSLTVSVGTLSSVMNVTMPVRLESRLIVELFDATLPQDLPYGPYILQKGNRMSRYAGEEEVTFVLEGAVYSAELDGILTYGTPTTLGGFTFFSDPTYGFLYVYGVDGSLIELEPGFFTLEIRVDADGDEEFEVSIPSSFFALLPS